MFHTVDTAPSARSMGLEFGIKWLLATALVVGSYRAVAAPPWTDDPAAQARADWRQSLSLEPVRESTRSLDGLELAYKRYARPGAQPLLLVHGLAQNDRGWDSRRAEYSMARFLHAQGFDVWIGNLRGAGTAGFRSGTPRGPHHWTVDDYAAHDLPALLEGVVQKTGQKPFFIGHSLAAWALEGALAGVRYDRDGVLKPSPALGARTLRLVRGAVTIAGVYSLWWPFALNQLHEKPVRCELDYYKSNYELEAMSRSDLLYNLVPRLAGLPLGWIGRVLNLPLDQIPLVGGWLKDAYEGFQNGVVQTPLLSMFYYPPNNDPDVVRLHADDGLEDLGPHLIEQLANAITSGETRSYYHRFPERTTYAYGQIRRQITVPQLFIAGGRDRLAGAEMIYRDGYQATAGKREYLLAEKFGHLDILNGRNAYAEVWTPLLKWLRSH